MSRVVDSRLNHLRGGSKRIAFWLDSGVYLGSVWFMAKTNQTKIWYYPENLASILFDTNI